MHKENAVQLLASWIRGEHREDLRYFEPRDFKDGHHAEIFRLVKEGKPEYQIIQRYNEDYREIFDFYLPSQYELAFKKATSGLPLRYATDGDTPEQIVEKIEDLDTRIKWARPISEEKVKGTLELMRGKIEAGNAPTIISTGFPHLDEKIDGGLRAGLYVIGAISSLGKTSFCIQLADNIAKAGKPVLFVSLEMRLYDDELWTQAFGHLNGLGRVHAKTTSLIAGS